MANNTKRTDLAALCGCETCSKLRRKPGMFNPLQIPGWSYSCEICSNKRCPHHADHRFACTNSNATDQVGVIGDEAALQTQRDAIAAERAKRTAEDSCAAQDRANGAALRRLVEQYPDSAVYHKSGRYEVYWWVDGDESKTRFVDEATLTEAVAAALEGG